MTLLLDSVQKSEAPDAIAALSGLLAFLKTQAYEFVTPSPATHARYLARCERLTARDVRDAFGWSMPFSSTLLPAAVLTSLQNSGFVSGEGPLVRSHIRVSKVGRDLFVHSAFPTLAVDSVFLGPDTYRFARAIAAHCVAEPRMLERIADIGCGAGVGGIVAAHLCTDASVTLVDINPIALFYSSANARAADCLRCETVRSDLLSDVDGAFDLIVANPPYLSDPLRRAYRDGGGSLGSDLSLSILHQCVDRLTPGGTLLLYTGSAIVDGTDHFRHDAKRALSGRTWSYEEIDPDVFGEDLETPAYAQADRIAVVLLTVKA